jgi:hypothetical protein
VAQSGRALGSGPRGRRFESSRPDHFNLQRGQLSLAFLLYPHFRSVCARSRFHPRAAWLQILSAARFPRKYLRRDSQAEGAAQIVMLTLCSSESDGIAGRRRIAGFLCKCRGSRLRVLRFPSEQSALQSRDQTSDEQHSGRQNGHAREYSGRIKNTLGLSNEVANTP